MALHARLFTHNILRVSKLKKWSHTTQAIDRNSERSSIAHCPQKTNGLADQEKAREDVLLSDTCSQTPPSPPWSLQPCCQDLLDSIVPACHQPTHREGAVCLTSQPALGLLAKDTLKTQEMSLTGVRCPQDYLPLIVKSVSYTTDDITTCPVDHERHVQHDVVYENHVVTMLTECSKDEQRPFSTAKDISRKSRLCSSEETDTSLLHRNHFRRHSICDSNPTHRQLLSIDFMLQCRGQSGSDTVFYNPVSDPDAVLCSSESGSSITQSGGEGQKSAGKGPNLDKLRAVETSFIEMVPKFFKSRLDYSLYHPEIVFENNFWGENKVTVGLNQYAMQLTKLRALTHLKYAHVHMEVVSSACLPEEGAIRIQWRVIGLSQFKALRFWKYTAWNYSKAFREDAEWIEGISVLHVNKEGLVTKHCLDRVTPSEEQLAKAPSLAAKLALLFGLSAPKPSLSDCSSFLCRQ